MQDALGVEPRHLGADGDLRPVPGLAGHRDDLDAAVGDLGHLEGEQLADQVRVGAGDGDLRAAEGAGHRHHVGLDPAAVGVLLAGHLLGLREHRLDLADVDQHGALDVAAVVRLHDAADDVALLAGVLAEGLLVLGVAQPLHDDLLGGAGRDPAEVGGGVVPLADDLAVGAELLGQDGDLAALAVDVHAHVLGGAVGVPVGGHEGRLDRLDHRVGGDALLPLDRLERGDVDVHCPPPRTCERRRSSVVVGARRRSSVVLGVPASGRPNSTCTRPAPSCAHGTCRGVGGRFFAPGLPFASTARVDPGVVDRGDPAGDLLGGAGRPDGDGDQPADVAPPVPGLGQRAGRRPGLVTSST